MNVCDELPILDLFSLNDVEFEGLKIVAGDSGKQGLATYKLLKPFIENEMFPVGFTIDWYGSLVPSGWLLMDGSPFSNIEFPELFKLLSSNSLPDYRDRSSMGSILSSNDTGSKEGVGEITLTVDNIPQHTHEYIDTVGKFNNISQGDHSTGKFEGNNRFRPSENPVDQSKSTSKTGGGNPVNNYQPVMVVRKLIKAR
mgnify:CR=1 FL=1